MPELQITVPQLEAALREAQSLVGRLRGLLARARSGSRPQQYTPTSKRNLGALKTDTGRLTDAGVAELRRMVDANVRDADIARQLEITPAAVAGRRQAYESERKRNPRKRP
jgi:hypothetical protein